jgi:hypothetical protein
MGRLCMMRFLAVSLVATTALALAMPPAIADELSAVYAGILADPTNSELNLQYAMIAEGRHEYRKALAAYERVLVNDPGNEAAKRGLQRVRRIIEPPLTQKTMEVGATWESNPMRAPIGDADFLGYGSFRIKDERPLGGHRWRTNLFLYGEAYAEQDTLDYASISGDIGPLVDIVGTNSTFRPAIGGGTAYFDDKVYYWDVNASGLFEGYLNGAYQWLRLRVGYRQYDPSFTSGAGAYADITGRFTVQDVFRERDALSLSPFARWSGIDGLPDNGALDFATGQYVEGGATLEYSAAVSDSLNAAVNIKVSDRVYDNIGTGSRHDWLIAPGASLVFRNLFGPQTDLRFDYKYEWNTSNMTDHTWENQAATVAFVVRR